MSNLIPLEQVAEDQRAVVAAYREAGGKSFQDFPIEVSRDNYEKSSAANGLERDEVASVEDVKIDEFQVRVYDPREQRDASSPVLVFAHGGGWVTGSLETHDPVCRRLATLTGLPVVAIDYRLGPEFPFPAGHMDCRRAVEWVRDEAQARSWNPQRIVTIGDSAGGGLATVLAYLPEMQVEGTKVTAQVLLYPVLDIAEESIGYERIAEGFPLTADTMRWFAEHLLADPADARDERVSPAQHVKVGDAPQPPALVLALGLDPLGVEAVEYARVIALNGTHVELLHLPNHAHGLFTSAGKIAMGAKILERSAQFIAEHA